MLEGLYREFVEPTAQYRGKPFWSWNGKLDKNELLRQVGVMKEMGFGGFFMHSRTGLVTEYLSDEWFELINACADEGEKLGMEAWLYDEDRWPSGTAGGMVTEEPRFRMKLLRMQLIEAAEFRWSEEVIAAFIAELDGLVLHEYRQLSRNEASDLSASAVVLAFTVEEMARSPFYNGFTYVDTLNPEATQAFLQSTHEKYKERCAHRLGRTIRGIFTDEPHRGRLMSNFGSSPGEGAADLEYTVPWTAALFDEFQAKFGYNLTERLPELFLWYKGTKVSQVKWHYVETVQQMFLNHFAKPMHEWCEANGMILTGHALHEDSLTAQTAMSGSMMRFYEHMGYPGVDVLSEHNRCYWLVKQLSSAARQLGRKWLLSELYGCTGWQMPFESHKAVGDWQALFGINLRCPHLSWYSMQGEAKRDFPASILHQSAWWKEYRFVENYFSRIGVILSQGTPVCDTLVLHPVESVWCQVHPGWCKGLAANAKEIVQLEKQFSDLFHWLAGAHIDFDYGDEEMMSRLCRIEPASDGAPRLMVGHAGYRQVVVAGMTTIRSSTLSILKEFIAAGGNVIFAGDAPAYVDAMPSDDAVAVSAAALRTGFERDSIVKACRSGVRLPVTVLGPDAREELADILVQVREDDDGHRFIMMLNVNREIAYPQATVVIEGDGFVQEWDCATGERHTLGSSRDGRCEFPVDFPPGGEHVFIVASKPDPSVPVKAEFAEKARYPLSDCFPYELDEPNVCVLDMARFRIDRREWHPEKEILKVDRQIRSSFGLDLRAGNMIQPWFANKSDKSESEVRGIVELGFDFDISELPFGDVELVMEQPEHFRVRLNGHPVDTGKRSGWWVDICFARIPLDKGLLVTGKNTIELETDFHKDVNLESLYLLGNFGVRLDGRKKTLVRLPDRLACSDLTTQGLPFYSGKVTYILPVNLEAELQNEMFIELERFSGACALIETRNGNPKWIAWQPYEANITEAWKDGGQIRLQLILTRRNTFGPLHQIPLYARAYGPGNFVTEGAGFTENYMLVPTGLLAPPTICVKSHLR